jgi:hypothetical protein
MRMATVVSLGGVSGTTGGEASGVVSGAMPGAAAGVAARVLPALVETGLVFLFMRCPLK